MTTMTKPKKIVALLLCIMILLQYIPEHKVNATTINEAQTTIVTTDELIKETIFDGVHIEGIESKGHTKRLREQEDLNTYVFENADGTNTNTCINTSIKHNNFRIIKSTS